MEGAGDIAVCCLGAVALAPADGGAIPQLSIAPLVDFPVSPLPVSGTSTTSRTTRKPWEGVPLVVEPRQRNDDRHNEPPWNQQPPRLTPREPLMGRFQSLSQSFASYHSPLTGLFFLSSNSLPCFMVLDCNDAHHMSSHQRNSRVVASQTEMVHAGNTQKQLLE